jgi:hypothetical protein
MKDWRSIDTAPRDGTIIEVMDPIAGGFRCAGMLPAITRYFRKSKATAFGNAPATISHGARTKAPDLAIGDPSHSAAARNEVRTEQAALASHARPA